MEKGARFENFKEMEFLDEPRNETFAEASLSSKSGLLEIIFESKRPENSLDRKDRP